MKDDVGCTERSSQSWKVPPQTLRFLEIIILFPPKAAGSLTMQFTFAQDIKSCRVLIPCIFEDMMSDLRIHFSSRAFQQLSWGRMSSEELCVVEELQEATAHAREMSAWDHSRKRHCLSGSRGMKKNMCLLKKKMISTNPLVHRLANVSCRKFME